MPFASEAIGQNPRIGPLNRYEEILLLALGTEEELLIILIFEVNSMVEFFEHCG